MFFKMCDDNAQNGTDISSAEESEHFYKIICAFLSYRKFTMAFINKRLTYLSSLPEKQQIAYHNYKDMLEEVKKCIELNNRILKLITHDLGKMFENTRHVWEQNMSVLRNKMTSEDIDKVQITLKQFYRDWSREGAHEREQAYNPIIETIENHFPESTCHREDVKVLVPGAGLGRLAFEIAMRGFRCQGNEFSFFMLFAANFVLNRCCDVDMYTVYPWVLQVDNNVTSINQIKGVTFPDCNPSDLSTKFGESRFSMAAGDFLEVYITENEWDCVATCFFIDCANNIYTFIEQIYRILKPGGIWVNLGPLQYHFSTTLSEDSLEPSYEEVKEIIRSIGFEIKKEETGIKTTYSQNPNAMLKHVFECVFFVCVKPADMTNCAKETKKDPITTNNTTTTSTFDT